ncbi:protein POLAR LOCALIZATION DURING ASYMMETRIC DIVISION AND REDISTRIBUTION-like isoform X2 [Amaranthus tricolor]|nr:protein POLAR LOCALIZATION DURING ASYMMETRIC DIVISION AND REDISTRIBUTION-like isoform X2 [Amaranthus tricolor]XP_057517313.1 protein POLAR LOCALIZATION DURING ASYMMETRIC DIVISION AND REDISTRIBUTION-like isoform X2 [Amaranthus tricolor]
MSNLIANKAEEEKLKDRLKESENLAQDLQEELEMKDSLTVKELVNDDDSQDTHESSNSHEKISLFSNQTDSGVPIGYDDEESVSLEKIESLSKIEAELEAELERLELSMKGSSLQEGKSDAFEFYQDTDQDVSAELVQGELNADIFGGKSSSEVTPDRGSTPQYVQEGVSPHELSLRLHEVIQSRLQQRIMELEAELVKSQKRIQRLESEKNNWRDVSRSESSSNMGSPVARPLKMNPSGDAIGAYNEIHGELSKINGSQNAGSWIHDGNQEDDTRLSSDQGMKKKLNPNQNGGNRILPNESSQNKDDDRDDDDDNDLLLIKHIVEKARQGSPAILKAQKAMLWLNKDN